MTVSVQDPVISYTGNGVTDEFAYNFRIISEDDLYVYLDGVLQSAGYTVDGVGDAVGGSVTFTIPPTSGVTVRLQRIVSLDREVDYVNGGSLLESVLDSDFDRVWFGLQDLDRVAFKENSDAALDADNRVLANLADPVSAQDAATKNWSETSGDSYVGASAASAAAAAASESAAASSASSASTSASNASTSETNAASSASAASTSETNAAASEAAAAASETYVEDWASKTNGIVEATDYSAKAYAIGGTGVTDTAGKGAAKEWATAAEDDTVDGTEYSAKHYSAKASASASAASTSESNASTSETNAATSASNASTSETNAASSASAASTSETNAAASESAAVAAANSVIWNDVAFKTFTDSPITIADTDDGKLIAVDTSSGNVTINLPSIAAITHPFTLGVKKTSSDGNTITINRNGTDTIDGGTTKVIQQEDAGAILIADEDPVPDEWTAIDFGAVTGNMTVDNFDAGVDYTAGTTTALTLSTAPGHENNIWVSFDGVSQHHDTYSVSGTTLTFDTAIPLDVEAVEVTIGTTVTIGVPNDNTVSTAKIVDGAVTAAKLGSDAVTTVKIIDDAVTTDKIVDGAVTAAKLGSDAVTTVKIDDDAVTTVKIDDDAVTSAKIADNAVSYAQLDTTLQNIIYRKNHILNGDLAHWQRGTSYATTTTEAIVYLADNWTVYHYGGMRFGAQRSTDVPTVAQVGSALKYSYYIDVTAADTPDGTTEASMSTKIEGLDFRELVGRECTLSWWVKATKTGTSSLTFRNNSTATTRKSYVGEYTINASETWERKEVTVTFDSTFDWLLTGGIADITINWALIDGLAETSTVDQWQTGNYVASSNQVNHCDSTANNFKIAGVQLEVGDTATDFTPSDPPSVSIQRCKRYYQKAPALYGHAKSATEAYATWTFSTEMATENPTIALWDNTPTIEHIPYVDNKTGASSVLHSTANHNSSRGCDFFCTGFSGLVATNPLIFIADQVYATAYLAG